MTINLTLVLLALTATLLMRPWRLMSGATRLWPMLSALTPIPWLWAIPTLQEIPLQLQGSGACLLLPVLCAAGVIAVLISLMPSETALDLTVWLVP